MIEEAVAKMKDYLTDKTLDVAAIWSDNNQE
jgi:hypothetical protein